MSQPVSHPVRANETQKSIHQNRRITNRRFGTHRQSRGDPLSREKALSRHPRVGPTRRSLASVPRVVVVVVVVVAAPFPARTIRENFYPPPPRTSEACRARPPRRARRARARARPREPSAREPPRRASRRTHRGLPRPTAVVPRRALRRRQRERYRRHRRRVRVVRASTATCRPSPERFPSCEKALFPEKVSACARDATR